MNDGVRNARIEGTRLGFGNDHGFLDHMLTLVFDGGGCGWGGYVLGFQRGDRDNGSIAADAIIWILNTVGATDWEQLRGKPIRIYTSGHVGGRVQAIGHFLDDKWMWFKDGVHHGTLAQLRDEVPLE